MSDTGKVFMNGRSQAVRLPVDYRFNTKEVYIRKNEETGEVILTEKPEGWTGFFALADKTSGAKDFLLDRQDEVAQVRDL
ncbi:MAG: type II toxin-antitoxin system VapB family antitoxin [Candidatus Hinthialibacter antarcticus]|nr:type II toxin-antitoxin system VapB family antitoxin [Candidatus Hinthialibacter antarcticus]